jgi:hypothetical protein
MKKVTMVEKVTYFCDICGFDITNEYMSVCKICGSEHCKMCHHTIKGSKDMLMGICVICYNTYDKFKKEMDDCYAKYDILYTHDVNEIFDEWKKESLLIKNKGETK